MRRWRGGRAGASHRGQSPNPDHDSLVPATLPTRREVVLLFSIMDEFHSALAEHNTRALLNRTVGGEA